MQGSRFSSPNGNLTSLTFRSFPYNWCEISPCWFVFSLTAKVSLKEIVGRFEGRLCLVARSEVINDNASEAFKILSPSLALTLKNVGMWSRCISCATVALTSQVYLWISSAHALWNFPSFEPKPHFQKFVLEEIECERKADGIEIELSSDAIDTAEDLGFDNQSYCGWYSHCGMQMQTDADTDKKLAAWTWVKPIKYKPSTNLNS